MKKYLIITNASWLEYTFEADTFDIDEHGNLHVIVEAKATPIATFAKSAWRQIVEV